MLVKIKFLSVFFVFRVVLTEKFVGNLFKGLVADEVKMEANNADHQGRHFVDSFTAEVDVVQAGVKFDGHLQQHEPDIGEVEDLIEDASKVGKLGYGVPVDEGTEEISQHADLVAEHEENSLQAGEHSQDPQNLADYSGLLRWRCHSAQHSNKTTQLQYQSPNAQQIYSMKADLQTDPVLAQANKERNERIRAYLEKERADLMQEVEENIQKVVEEELRGQSPDRRRLPQEKLDEIYEILQVFLRASHKLAETYFLMLQSSDSIELCTEKMLVEKAGDFKAALLRSARNMELRVKETGTDVKTQRRSVRKSKSNPNSLEKSHILVRWLLENFQNPYPSKLEKQRMIEETGLSLRQINNWFINVRERTVKKYLRKEQKDAPEDDNEEQDLDNDSLNSPTFIMPDNIVKQEEQAANRPA